MNKVIFIVLAWTLVLALAAELPQWYPKNVIQILSKCKSEHPWPAKVNEQMQDKQLPEGNEVRARLLCVFRGMNVYSPDSGFNVERLADNVYRSSSNPCSLKIARECVSKHEDVQPKDDSVYHVMKCVVGEVTKGVVLPDCDYKP